jgi:hypothetical protein
MDMAKLGGGVAVIRIGAATETEMKEGIIDPVKVTKSALLNAVSVASTLLTTEAAVADMTDKTSPAGNPDMGY